MKYLLLCTATLVAPAAFAQTATDTMGAGDAWWNGGEGFFADDTRTTLRSDDEIRTHWETMNAEDQAALRARCADVGTEGGNVTDLSGTGAAGTLGTDGDTAGTGATGTGTTGTGSDATGTGTTGTGGDTTGTGATGTGSDTTGTGTATTSTTGTGGDTTGTDTTGTGTDTTGTGTDTTGTGTDTTGSDLAGDGGAVDQGTDGTIGDHGDTAAVGEGHSDTAEVGTEEGTSLMPSEMQLTQICSVVNSL